MCIICMTDTYGFGDLRKSSDYTIYNDQQNTKNIHFYLRINLTNISQDISVSISTMFLGRNTTANTMIHDPTIPVI